MPDTIVVIETTNQPVVVQTTQDVATVSTSGPTTVVVETLQDVAVDRTQFEEVVINEGAPGPPGPGATFINPDPCTIAVGGIPIGTAFPVAQTMQEMWQAALYPYLNPAFASFGISGVSSPLEVGASFGPNVTFTWSTNNGQNVQANSIAISDAGTPIATGLANSGSHALTLGSAVTRSTSGTHQYGVSGENTESANFSTTVTYQWQWRVYFGTNTSSDLVAAQILALAGSRLANGYAGTYALSSGGYKFICFADAGAGQLNSVKDQATGFNVPMAPGSHTDGGSFGYELVSVTNVQGITTNVRVYHTLNLLGGAITLVVT